MAGTHMRMPAAGDGAGILVAMPDGFLSSVMLEEQGVKLPPLGEWVCHVRTMMSTRLLSLLPLVDHWLEMWGGLVREAMAGLQMVQRCALNAFLH
jgi:hypothetical protein